MPILDSYFFRTSTVAPWGQVSKWGGGENPEFPTGSISLLAVV